MNIKHFVFNPFGVSTYVVWDPESAIGIVVDPGMSNSSEQRLFDDFIAANHIHLSQIVNTHLHIDHCWGNSYVKNRYGVTVAGNTDDAFLGERVLQQARMFGIFDDSLTNALIDVPLRDGDIVKVGNGSLEVLSVPGHSPGSIALYDRADGWIIVGDALFAGAIGRTDLPGGDLNTLLHSIKSKLLTLPPNTVVYPGHEQTTTIGRELAYNPYLKG